MSERVLQSKLARELLRLYPGRAAAELERLPVAEVARVLGGYSAEVGAAATRHMTAHHAAAIFARAEPAHAAAILTELAPTVAAAVLRRTEEGPRRAILGEISESAGATLRAVMRFPDGTVGSLMDPLALSLPDDLPAREAVSRVRRAAAHARYNLYVVDRDGCLVGVLNLRELFLARPRSVLSEVMHREPQRLEASADRMAIVKHRGWREVHSLPVVDAEGHYVGAVRYATLRRLEAELRGKPVQEKDTGEALGEVFAAGAAALVDALAGASRAGRDDR